VVRPSPSGSVARLAGLLLEHAVGDPLGDELTDWLGRSSRFRAFVEANRDKIRKKVRGAADPEARLDVRAELRTAHRLLADRRIELAFEPYGSGRAGPDFAVRFRTAPAFNLEVTRLRREPGEAALGGLILVKLRQLPPSIPNAILVVVEGDVATVDVAGAARRLRARADRKEEAFFTARGFTDTRAFYERYLRLGGVFVYSEVAPGDARATLWVNPSARIALPDRAAAACLGCLNAET
jgi:hypothetical protein